MSGTQHKNWLQAFDIFYEWHCENGESCEDAVTYALEDATEIYPQQEEAA